MMRDFLNKTELLAALQAGKRLEAGPRTDYAGEAVEYAPARTRLTVTPTSTPGASSGAPTGRGCPARGSS